jgi:hypothetical protein
MKIRTLNLIGFIIIPQIFGCGIEIPEDVEFNNGDQAALSDGNYYLDGSEYDASENTDVDEGELELVMATLKGLHKQERTIVSECMGISEQVAEFEVEKARLKNEGLEGQELRESLKEQHQALRELLEGDKEKFKECRVAARESVVGKTIENIIISCWSKPEDGNLQRRKSRRGPPKRFGLHGPASQEFASGEAMKKRPRKHHGLRLPPPFAAQFSTVACQDALASVGSEITETEVDSDAGNDEGSEEITVVE